MAESRDYASRSTFQYSLQFPKKSKPGGVCRIIKNPQILQCRSLRGDRLFSAVVFPTSTHMTYDLTEFHGSMRPSSQYITLADGSKIRAQGVGTVTIAVQIGGKYCDVKRLWIFYVGSSLLLTLTLVLIGQRANSNSKEIEVDIVNVQYSPELNSKLLSFGTLEKKGYYFTGKNGQLKLYDKDDSVVLEGTRNNEVYLINQPGIELKANRTTEFAGKAVSKLELWHREKDLRKLPKLTTGIDSTDQGGEATLC